MNISSIVIVTVLLAVTTLYFQRGLGRGRSMIRDRVGGVMESFGVLAVFSFALTNVAWTVTSPVMWIVAVLEAALGMFFLVRRWTALPPLRPGRRWTRIVRVVVGAVVGVVVIGITAATWS